ncbi:hypothetical protein SCARD494_09978 [Seiridium cardinale]
MTGNKRSRGRDDPRDDDPRKRHRDGRGRSRSSSPETVPRSDLQGNSRSIARTQNNVRAVQMNKIEIPLITMNSGGFELPAQLGTGSAVSRMTARDPNGLYAVAKIPDLTQRGPPAVSDRPFMPGYREERARAESRYSREKKRKSCELCKQENHETKHCHYLVDPTTRNGVPLGFTPVCPYHNTSSHTIDECHSLPFIMKDRRIAYRVFVQDRQDLPPILTDLVNWPELADEFNHDGSGPWQPKFALEQWKTPEVMESYWDRTPIVDPETEDLARILTLDPQTPTGAYPDVSLDDLKKHSMTAINEHHSRSVSGTSSRPSQHQAGLNVALRNCIKRALPPKPNETQGNPWLFRKPGEGEMADLARQRNKTQEAGSQMDDGGDVTMGGETASTATKLAAPRLIVTNPAGTNPTSTYLPLPIPMEYVYIKTEPETESEHDYKDDEDHKNTSAQPKPVLDFEVDSSMK